MEREIETTIIMIPKHNKPKRRGVELVLNEHRIDENRKHMFSLRDDK